MAVDVGTKTGQTNDDSDDANQVAVDAFTQVYFCTVTCNIASRLFEHISNSFHCCRSVTLSLAIVVCSSHHALAVSSMHLCAMEMA